MVESGEVDLEKLRRYMDKVDRFNETGEVTVTTLPYEGPDLSPGAARPNVMGGRSGRVTIPIVHPDGTSGGKRVVNLRGTLEDTEE